MSDWVEEVDIGGDRYGLKDLQTEATAQQNEQDIAAIKQSANYLTTEHSTGRKWVNNKPTYEITIDCGVLPNTTEKVITHNISNIENVVSIKGIAFEDQTNRSLPLPYMYTDLPFVIALNVSPTQIRIATGTDRSNFGHSFTTFEYTKTTDTPQP